MVSFYFLEDEQVPGATKVGKDTAWPSRFKQARCHSPGRIRARAVIRLPEASRALQGELDGLVNGALAMFRRDVAFHGIGVREWYDLPWESALQRVRVLGQFAAAEVAIDPDIQLPPSQLDYEDWRDRGHRDRRWRLFVFQVRDMQEATGHPHIGRFKVAAGSLYDTAYRYNFTYCPFPVVLVGGFESAAPIQDNNRSVIEAWREMVMRHGPGETGQPMGWLVPGVDRTTISEIAHKYGLAAFPLDRPKPSDARVKDPSVSETPIGSKHPVSRVDDLFSANVQAYT